MGTYNHVRLDLTCPRCCQEHSAEVDLYLGYTQDMVTVAIGDTYPFVDGKTPSDGGPVEGVSSEAGYAECPKCDGDYFCAVEIREGHLIDVRPNPLVPPYKPSRIADGVVSCPRCESRSTHHHEFRGLSVGRLICDASDCHGSWTTRFDPQVEAYVFEEGAVPA